MMFCFCFSFRHCFDSNCLSFREAVWIGPGRVYGEGEGGGGSIDKQIEKVTTFKLYARPIIACVSKG